MNLLAWIADYSKICARDSDSPVVHEVDRLIDSANPNLVPAIQKTFSAPNLRGMAFDMLALADEKDLSLQISPGVGTHVRLVSPHHTLEYGVLGTIEKQTSREFLVYQPRKGRYWVLHEHVTPAPYGHVTPAPYG